MSSRYFVSENTHPKVVRAIVLQTFEASPTQSQKLYASGPHPSYVAAKTVAYVQERLPVRCAISWETVVDTGDSRECSYLVFTLEPAHGAETL